MKSLLLPIHLTFAGIWLGCVITEALFERALLGKGRVFERILVELHKRVDLFVEIPAFLVVLLTGTLMLTEADGNELLHMKVGFGLLAVAANVYCVWLVFQRAAAANESRWEAFSRFDQLQHKFGAVVLLAIVTALGTGVYLYARVNSGNLTTTSFHPVTYAAQ